ncbi:MAG TPA: Rho termination factor N-terminal domain-containing protein [Acidimicrobiales bacterium]|nr:Rho termination factor N-terminal domain-containing protein [Acidimicrobiales bacterium]
MPGSKHGPEIKNPKQYEAMRDDGMSKEKAARISNAAHNQGKSKVAARGGRGGDYEDRSKEQLYSQAKKVGIEGRSHMSKGELIDALRNH